MKKFLEGSRAIAETIRLCKPGVISAYPITPQTHIVEELAQMVADGQLNSQFVNVESEHSAASVVLGAVATGVRVFTATSSQGLLLMSEVLFNIAGMRFPVILTCVNRSVSAPINIWNDQQDSMVLRDSGLLQFYAESIQEAADLHIFAYAIAEHSQVMLPAMVCVDGYILGHGHETVDIPEENLVKRFLPDYKPLYKLDPNEPLTLGCLAAPEHYMETRVALQETHKELIGLIEKKSIEFNKTFGRNSAGLIEEYKMSDAKQAIVALGSVCGTVKDVVDELRSKGEKLGLVKLITYRPFPAQAIYEALKNVERIAVIDKAISLGAWGPVYTDIKSAFYGKEKCPKINGFIMGLGGRDIKVSSVKSIVEKMRQKTIECEFIDINKELLKDKFE